jgi:hypothetical protein
MVAVSELNPFSELDFKRLLDDLEARARADAMVLGFDWEDALGMGAERHQLPTQILSVARSGLFDTDYYLKTHKDIAAAGIHPLRHYVEYGDAEGRWPNPYFNPKAYRAFFEDGALHGICTLYHYAELGEALGLGAPPDFDGHRYLATNPKLAPWLDRPFTHFLNIGRQHGLVLHHRIRLAAGQRVAVKAKPVLDPVSVPRDKLGINVVGPVEKVSGLGVSARGYISGLRRAGCERVGALAQPLAFVRQNSLSDTEYPVPPFIQGAPVNLVHMNGNALPFMLEHGAEAFLNGAHNIGVWYWELPVLPPEWHAALAYFHEFWAPTPFIAQALSAVTSKPVTVLPPYLDHLQGMQQQEAAAEGVAPYFLYCFDANSILERKNPIALVKAYLQAFPAGGDLHPVNLVLKVTYPDKAIDEVQELYAYANLCPRITIVDELMPSADLHELIGKALAYVSPHRSEGLGLTVIEAMAAGVPVVSTSFAGLAPFVDETTAWPIEFELAELSEECPPYPKGFVWADPNISSLAHQLRQVAAHPEAAQTRADRARRRVLDYFSSNQLVEKYRLAIKRTTN